MEPKWLTWARSQIGTKEIPGPGSNPTVEQYYQDAVRIHAHDDVPWCDAFIGAGLVRGGGIKPSGSLMARSYLTWGQKVGPIPGAIVVLKRGAPPFGHVAFVTEDYGDEIEVIGGNQSDAVTRAVYPKSRVLGYRWPLGVAVPTAKAYKHKLAKKTPKEGPMADMTPQQIMDAMSAIYKRVDRWGMGDLSEIKQAVKKSVECMFYLAKMQAPATPKAMKKGLKKPPARKPPAKRKKR